MKFIRQICTPIYLITFSYILNHNFKLKYLRNITFNDIINIIVIILIFITFFNFSLLYLSIS